MSAKQSHQAGERRPRVGEGRIGGFICAAIGLMSVASVLCLRFPAFLTTPELRVHYDVELLRLLLAICMIVAAGAGSLSLMLGGPRLRVAIGVGGLFLAMVLGGPDVPTKDFVQPRLYFGLDWLLLDLFFTGSGWILLEWMFPRVRPEQPPLREGWRLDLAYFGVNHLAIGVFLVVSTHFAHDAFGWAVNAWTQAEVNALPGIARFVLIILAADLAEYVLHRAFTKCRGYGASMRSITRRPRWTGCPDRVCISWSRWRHVRSSFYPFSCWAFRRTQSSPIRIFVSVQSTLIHSNIRMNAGWLRYVIVTPQFHHWHHASDAEAIDRNYTAHTPLWDLLFGTWHLPKDRWPVKYGTVKPVPGGSIRGELWYPFTGSVEGFRAALDEIARHQSRPTCRAENQLLEFPHGLLDTSGPRQIRCGPGAPGPGAKQPAPRRPYSPDLRPTPPCDTEPTNSRYAGSTWYGSDRRRGARARPTARACHFGKSPDLLELTEIRTYLIHLTQERHLAASSIIVTVLRALGTFVRQAASETLHGSRRTGRHYVSSDLLCAWNPPGRSRPDPAAGFRCLISGICFRVTIRRVRRRGGNMVCRKIALSIVAVTAFLVAPGVPRAQQPTEPKASDPTTVTIDDKSIGGTVTSRFGPEAGVWVIAETRDLGTRFAKIVVTDERGRYVIPDLPKANYRVWVRGYGLVDSEKVPAQLGKPLNLTAIVAPSLAAAAQYYPAIYWASMIRVPDKSRFPGTGDKGNGIPENFKTQEQWLNFVKTNGCGNCHQIGNYATRNIPAALGDFDSSRDAWSQRLSVGPAGHDMLNFITQVMTPDGGHLAALADWTDRVKAGELPSRSPPRPVGIERNLVDHGARLARPKALSA